MKNRICTLSSVTESVRTCVSKIQPLIDESPVGGCSEGLDAFRFFLENYKARTGERWEDPL